MKRIISTLIAAALVISSVGLLTGCGKQEPTGLTSEGPVALSFVLGLRSNFPGISSNAQDIYDRIYDACANYGEISYAVVEGKPEQTDTIRIEKSDKNLSEAKIKEVAKRNANSVMSGFASLSAKTPEADVLQTIRLAADAVSSSSLTDKKLVIYDNGLCTTGLLSQLSYNVLATDPEIIADKLEALHALPSLEGVEVMWIGLGCVSGDQPAIPDSYKYKLRELWTTIVERSGGTITFDTTPITGDEQEGLPKVSVVEFPVDDLGIGSTSVIKLKDDTCKFIGDKAELIDADAAKEAIKPFAEYLKNDPKAQVIIAGTTAKVGNGDGVQLSYERTQTVKKMLLDLGVNNNQIECIGLGCTDNCLRVEDHNADGSLNEEMAAENRAIYLILANSETAKNILSGINY